MSSKFKSGRERGDDNRLRLLIPKQSMCRRRLGRRGSRRGCDQPEEEAVPSGSCQDSPCSISIRLGGAWSPARFGGDLCNPWRNTCFHLSLFAGSFRAFHDRITESHVQIRVAAGPSHPALVETGFAVALGVNPDPLQTPGGHYNFLRIRRLRWSRICLQGSKQHDRGNVEKHQFSFARSE